MNSATSPHLRVANKLSNSNTELDVPSALAAIEGAETSTEAFMRLQSWATGPAAMLAQAHEVERNIAEGGQEVLRLLMQDFMDARGDGDVGRALVVQNNDSRVVRLNEKRRGRSRNYESVFGTVRASRVGYSAENEATVYPLDAELNLPKRKYSFEVQRRAATMVGRAPYEEAQQTLKETTAAHVPKRQLEKIAEEASCDFDSFYEERATQAQQRADESGPILVGGVDCKGVPRKKTDEEKAESQHGRLGPGEKKQKKKMATVASVHTQQPHVRSPEEVVEQLMDPEPPKPEQPRPRPENRRIWASVTKSKDDVIKECTAEMARRDPGREKTAVCLLDGERALQKRALQYMVALFPALLMVLDIIHVLEYLWKAAYAFHEVGSEQARLWVRERLLRILQGEVSAVAAGIRQSATKKGLKGKRRQAVDKACGYFLKNKSYMRYDEYLALGLPIASGNVEGACGHLVKDRMERTGAIWTLDGAEAVLKLRAIEKSGDVDDYWTFHLDQEQQRNYPSRRLAVAS